MERQSTTALTFRAVFSGLIVGCLISASNVTIGLMIGWTFGASITAAVISFAIFRGLASAKNPYTAQENLISATAGSSSGTMASAGGFVAAIPALEMIRAQKGLEPLGLGSLVIWAISIAFLGVHFAVPLRKQMVVVEKLRYPTGTAAAETIKAMYASGVEAMKKTKVLIWSGILAAVITFLFLRVPFFSALEVLSFNDFGLWQVALLAIPLYQLHIGFSISPMMLGAGVLIGPKVGWSLFAGAIIAWVIITPILIDRGVVEVAPDVDEIRSAVSSLHSAEEGSRAYRHAETELQRGLDDSMVRLNRLVANREGEDAITKSAILTEFLHFDILQALDDYTESTITGIGTVIDLYETEGAEAAYLSADQRGFSRDVVNVALATVGIIDMPEMMFVTNGHHVGEETASYLGASAQLFRAAEVDEGAQENLAVWAAVQSHYEPAEELAWQAEAAIVRTALAAAQGREVDLTTEMRPYLASIPVLQASGVEVTHLATVRASIDSMMTAATASIAAGTPWRTQQELQLRAEELDRELAFNLPDTDNPYRAGFNWVLWTGVALMVAASFTSLALQYKVIAKTFTSLKSAAAGGGGADEDEEEDAPDPYPMKYWVVGMALATALTVILAKMYFDIPVWEGLLAVILSMLIAAIAVRATGETDINPVGAMGKITQVIYGALAPGKIQVNLMAAAITAAGSSQAGDLMHDLKAGHMLKVSIRQQVFTQLIGVIVGVFAAAGTFRVLSAVYDIPGDRFPGPAVYAWYKMAEILAEGFTALPPGALWGAAIGAALGIILPLISKFAPKIGKWMPSPVAFGIAFIVHAQYSFGMWLGAMITYFWMKRNEETVDKYGFSMASGLIAGAGLMLVGYALFLMITQVLLA